MHPFFKDYLERLTELHKDCLNAIEGLEPKTLDWTPLENPTGDMNSINVLVSHFCGAERYWIGDIAAGDPSNRDRDSEFRVQEITADELAKKINTATTYAKSTLKKLNIDDFSIQKTTLRDGRTASMGWALLHALEHTAIHVGHIQITRQLWAER